MWVSPNTDTGGVWRLVTGQIYRAVPSAEVMRRLAQKVTIMTGHGSRWGAWADDFMAVNPRGSFQVYVKSIQNQGDPGFPEPWFAHDRSGDRIIAFGGNVFLMDPDRGPAWDGVPNFREWHARDVQRDVAAANKPYGGAKPIRDAWSDSMGAFAYQGPPINPVTKEPYSLAEWIRKVWDQIPPVRRLNPDMFVSANGMQDLTRPYWDRVMGLMDENWLRKPDAGVGLDNWPTGTAWEADVDIGLECQRTRGASGEFLVAEFLGRARNPNLDDQDRNRIRDYWLASYHLTNRGSAYIDLAMKGDNVGPWEYGELDHPAYEPRLGAPKESETSARAMQVTPAPARTPGGGGLYCRRFANGVSLVNCSRVELSSTVDGRKWTLPAQSGKTAVA